MNDRNNPGHKLVNATDAILDNLLDAVLMVDEGGIIVYANRSARELFEKTSEELIGQPFGFPVLPQQMQEIGLLKDGELLAVQMLASHIEWEGRTASLLSLRDITLQKRTAEELKERQRQLEQTSEENAQFASMASHDLKEPVRKIIFFSDRLLSGGALAPPEKEQVTRILRSAQRMNALIAGIADLSKVSHLALVFEPVDLKKIVDEVCEDLEFQIAEKGAVVHRADLPIVEAVPDKMYQLFLNLISNSLKYSRANVAPTIRVYGEPDEDEFVKIIASDNGIGFEPALAQQLFQPFRRLHRNEYEGVGIGLALCQKIVDLHGGDIQADGRPGQGARFTIRLPRAQQKRLTRPVAY